MTEDGGRRAEDSPQRHRGHGEKTKKLCKDGSGFPYCRYLETVLGASLL